MNVKHFCSFQDPPCNNNECRVATHIIAGLYPCNFSKFLIKAYQPLNEEERKELMSIQKLYFTYLMQKLCDDKSKTIDPMHQMDLLWNIDDSDYTLFCDIGSAFAECYLTDIVIPVTDLLDSCFIMDNGDIELNMYWLECVYLFKESDNWPLKKLENDPKVLELQLRMRMDQISLNTAKLRAQAQQSENPVDPVTGTSQIVRLPGRSRLWSKPAFRPQEEMGRLKLETDSDYDEDDDMYDSDYPYDLDEYDPEYSSTAEKAFEEAAFKRFERKMMELDYCGEFEDEDDDDDEEHFFYEPCGKVAKQLDPKAKIADVVKIAVKQKLNQ